MAYAISMVMLEWRPHVDITLWRQVPGHRSYAQIKRIDDVPIDKAEEAVEDMCSDYKVSMEDIGIYDTNGITGKIGFVSNSNPVAMALEMAALNAKRYKRKKSDLDLRESQIPEESFMPGQYWIRFLKISVYGDEPKLIRGLWEARVNSLEGDGAIFVVDFDGDMRVCRFFPKETNPHGSNDDFEEWDRNTVDDVLHLFSDRAIDSIEDHMKKNLSESKWNGEIQAKYAVEVWYTPDEKGDFYWRLKLAIKYPEDGTAEEDWKIKPAVRFAPADENGNSVFFTDKIEPDYADSADEIRRQVKEALENHWNYIAKHYPEKIPTIDYAKYENLMVYQTKFPFMSILVDPKGQDPVDMAIYFAKMKGNRP